MPVITEYHGVKYSLQPHGFKSRMILLKRRLPVLLASFVLSLGAGLMVSTSAHAAGPTQYFVTSCGNSTDWYVNGDEGTVSTADDGQGDRRPLAVSDGLVFSPTDLIHHLIPGSNPPDLLVTSSLQPGTFVASPAPDLPDFFSIEVVDDNGSGYGTLRWNSSSSLWSATKNGDTHTGTDPAAVLTSFNPDLSLHARTFGVGYTNAPPGTVTSLVSSISFMGTTYKVSCPVAPSPSPSPSPVTITVTKKVTVPAAAPAPTTTMAETPSPTPTSVAATMPGKTPDPTLAPAAATEDSGGSLAPWGIGVAAVVGTGLLATGIVGIVRRRREYQDDGGEEMEYQGAHAVKNDETQLIPPYNPHLGDGVSVVENPFMGDGFSAEEGEMDDTTVIPTAPDTETKVIPPVSE